VYGLTIVWAITILAAGGALWRPALALYAYIFFAVLRPHFLFGFAGSMANVSDIVGIAMLVGWALHGFGSWRLGRGWTITVSLVLFTAWVWLSATQALYPSVSYAWGLEMLKILAPFLVGVTLLSTPAEWRILLWTIVAATGYIGFEMNLQYVRGFNQVGAYGYGGMDNNSFGIALVTTLGPAFALAVMEKRLWLRVTAAVCAAAILHTILLTFSRGAFVGLLVLGVATFLIMPKRPKYLLALLLISLVTFRFVGPQLADRFSTVFVSADERDASSESRLLLWQDCVDMALTHPLFGVGPRHFPIHASDYGWPPGKEAHSVWMQTFAETGFPGVSFLLLFFGWTMVRMWPIARARITDENRLEVGVATGVMLGIIGFVVAGQFVSLTGLEVPYYIALTGLVLLKSRDARQAVATTRPAVALAPGPGRAAPSTPPLTPAIRSYPLRAEARMSRRPLA
jgi:probable O-glycosylation ligase (exosortase A-associated)